MEVTVGVSLDCVFVVSADCVVDWLDDGVAVDEVTVVDSVGAGAAGSEGAEETG